MLPGPKSCVYSSLPAAGCTDSQAVNYRPIATHDSRDYVCVYSGCLDTNALNFDPSASVSGVCIDKAVGCMQPEAIDYWASANTPGPCQYLGCLDSLRLNYDPTANGEGGCIETYPGCTDSAGLNFDVQYNFDNGKCQIGGCTIEGDANYNPRASFFDGTCEGAAARRRKLDGDAGSAGCMSPLVTHSVTPTTHHPPTHHCLVTPSRRNTLLMMPHDCDGRL